MSRDTRSLLVLTLFCTLAGAFFGFGTIAFSFQSAYNRLGREPLLFLAREIVYVVLAVVLVMRGGWRGVLGSVGMAVGATTIEWLLFPAAYTWAGTVDPAGYAQDSPTSGVPPTRAGPLWTWLASAPSPPSPRCCGSRPALIPGLLRANNFDLFVLFEVQ